MRKILRYFVNYITGIILGKSTYLETSKKQYFLVGWFVDSAAIRTLVIAENYVWKLLFNFFSYCSILDFLPISCSISALFLYQRGPVRYSNKGCSITFLSQLFFFYCYQCLNEISKYIILIFARTVFVRFPHDTPLKQHTYISFEN